MHTEIDHPESPTRIAICRICGHRWEIPVPMIFGREFAAKAERVCDPCIASYQKGREAESEAEAWKRLLCSRMPDTYRTADATKVKAPLRKVVEWAGEPEGGVGILAPSNYGKSFALACLIARAHMDFFWWHGAAIRAHAQRAISADRTERANTEWLPAHTVAFLVLDDFCHLPFSEKFNYHLLGLLEARTASGRPTFWTSQHSQPALLAKITRAGNQEQGAAIMRRLVQNTLIVSTL